MQAGSRSWRPFRHLLVLGLLTLLACRPSDSNNADDGGVDDSDVTDGGSNDGGRDTGTDGRPDGSVPSLVTVRGTVWSPGADLATVLENNRFPIPNAAVIAYSTEPPPIPQAAYCNECVDVPEGTPNTMSDAIDGSFELQLLGGRTYYLAVQRGDFRRVRQYTVPDTPGEVVEIASAAGAPRPELTTLPARTDSGLGDNIPKIAMIRGAYEDMFVMFNALGFNYDHAGDDFDVYCAPNPFHPCPGQQAAALVNDPARLAQYNMIIVTCGADWPTASSSAAANLREWVRNGGSLYVDDFNYDFVEQPWPEFLSFYQDTDGDGNSGMGECGTASRPSNGSGNCNNWSEYDFTGAASDAPEFAEWLRLPEVNRGADMTLYAAWDYIHELGEGEIGVDDESGETVFSEPLVWMYNQDSVPFGGAHVPATVSWPYYCGRVLYTVYHTHSGSAGAGGYELLLQEKIMMYLIMEVQTCASELMVY
jgi:hypothetical protein